MKKPKQTATKTRKSSGTSKAASHEQRSDVTDLLEKLHAQRATNRKTKVADANPPDLEHPATEEYAALKLFELSARLEIPLPEQAHVIGEPVTITNIRNLNPRVGLVATCQRGKHTYDVSFADITFAPDSLAAGISARYRAWLGLDPAVPPTDLQEPASARLDLTTDPTALNLIPLKLRNYGEWDPKRDYWREEHDPIDDWAKRIIARGKRPMHEMEQLRPGTEPDDFDTDPILEASELNAAGNQDAAREILINLLAQDIRCLDAHAHLGNFAFPHAPEEAQRHYQTGAAIGGLSLPKNFEGVLAWGLTDNRPYLRCLNGAGVCAWRLGDNQTAKTIFERMLWLNPTDNQGARFNLAAIEAGKTWEEVEGDD